MGNRTGKLNTFDNLRRRLFVSSSFCSIQKPNKDQRGSYEPPPAQHTAYLIETVDTWSSVRSYTISSEQPSVFDYRGAAGTAGSALSGSNVPGPTGTTGSALPDRSACGQCECKVFLGADAADRPPTRTRALCTCSHPYAWHKPINGYGDLSIVQLLESKIPLFAQRMKTQSSDIKSPISQGLLEPLISKSKEPLVPASKEPLDPASKEPLVPASKKSGSFYSLDHRPDHHPRVRFKHRIVDEEHGPTFDEACVRLRQKHEAIV